MMKKYQEIIFLQGDKAVKVFDILQKEDEEAAIEYLVEWDYGEGKISDEPQYGKKDDIYSHNWGGTDYILTWNRKLGYIALHKILEV